LTKKKTGIISSYLGTAGLISNVQLFTSSIYINICVNTHILALWDVLVMACVMKRRLLACDCNVLQMIYKWSDA